MRSCSGCHPPGGMALGVLPGDAGVDPPERVDDLDREVAAVGQRDAARRANHRQA